MRRAAKIDQNQNEIVKSLRQIPGVTVAITSGVGKGYPDINVGLRGKTFLIELKNSKKTASQKRLKPDQEKFQKEWTGSYAVCETFQEVLKAIGL